MSATQAFFDRWKVGGRSVATLVQIDLLAGASSALTIYASHGLVSTPNGNLWEPLLDDVEPISAPGSFGTSDIPLCSTRVKLNNKRVSSQAGPFATLLNGRSVIGSAVTIRLWETGLTSWADALIVFKGVIQNYEVKVGSVILNLRQRTDWNRPMPPDTLDPSIYHRAPEGGRGAPLPVVYGKVTGPGLRSPHTPDFSLTQRRLEMVRVLGPRGLSRGAVVDVGRGGTARPKVLAAAHKVVNLSDPAKGTGVWAEIEGKMVLVNAQPADVINTSSEAGILTSDDQDALVMVDIGEVVAGIANPAHNPRYCMEPNDVTYAELDYDLSQRDLQIRLASMPEIGSFASTTALVVYEATSGTALRLQAIPPSGAPVEVALGATTIPTLATLPAAPSAGSWGDLNNYVLRVYFNGVATGSYVKVYFVGLLIGTDLRHKVVVAAHKVDTNRKRPTVRFGPLGTTLGPFVIWDDIPDATELTGDYYWNLHGMGDENPVVAGVVDALLEQAPHLYAHILGRFGGQQLGTQITEGATTFGNYGDAVADFKSWTTRIMPFGLTVSETSDVMTVLSWLASSSQSFVYLDRFTDRFNFIPWKLDRPVDWFFTFTPRELNELAPECSMMPDSSVVTAIRLRYGWNGKDGGFDEETAVASSHSNAGQKYVNLRDENLAIITGVNDRIGFSTTGGVFEATLSQATVDALVASGFSLPAAIAAHTQTILNGTDVGPRDFYCHYIGTITLNHNDRISVSDGVTARDITIPPGIYTMEGLASTLTTLINASGTSGWTVSYSRITRKFTISRASGTAWLVFDRVGMEARQAAVSLGFRPQTQMGSSSYVGDVEVEEQRFAFGCSGSNIDLKWATGAAGSSESAVPRTAASLFGFDPRFNSGRNTARIHSGVCPKGNREAALATAESLYGAKREGTYEARCVYDGEVAREMRNRIMDLYSKPRLRIEFTTEQAPDIERGRVIQFGSDFDAIMPYPEPGTDGSWVGKRFVVVETEQHLGPTSYSTRVVAVSLG